MARTAFNPILGFVPVRPVVGREEQLAVHVGQVIGVGTAAAGVDVLDHHGVAIRLGQS
jgi:hypothetical protein